MPVAQLNTNKSWTVLLSELSEEMRLWGIVDYELPRYEESNRAGVVRFKFAVGGNWVTPSCSNFSHQRNGTKRNLAAIVRSVRDARIADQRGIGAILAEVTKHLALPAGAVEDEDPYSVLGIAKGSSVEAIRAVFTAKRNKAHPDSGGSAEEFKRVMKAGEALGVS